MANWTKDTQQNETSSKENIAYIDKGTIEAAKENTIINTLSKAVFERATELMNKLEKAKLTTTSQTQPDEKGDTKNYTDKAVIKVEPAMKWNKETKEEEPLIHKDGSQVYKATAEIKHSGTTLSLTAKEDVTEGAKFVAMSASKWDRSNGTSRLNFYKQDDIANAPINEDIKAIANFAKENGFIEKRETKVMGSPLKEFTIQANRYFSANSEKVVNENSELVNNAYAKYEDGNYGERVTLYNHNDNTAIELGTTSGGDKYALAINYDLNRDFKSRQQGEKPAKVYINKAEDVDKFVDLPEIKDIVTEFKNFNEKETKKEQPKEKNEAENER